MISPPEALVGAHDEEGDNENWQHRGDEDRHGRLERRVIGERAKTVPSGRLRSGIGRSDQCVNLRIAQCGRCEHIELDRLATRRGEEGEHLCPGKLA